MSAYRVIDCNRSRAFCWVASGVVTTSKTCPVEPLDVNPNRAPWVWVRSEELIAAMRTFDTVENRGYLLVSDVE